VTLEVPATSDNVGVATISSDAPEKFPVGQTIVTWTATDATGNEQTTIQQITITDTVPPKFAKIKEVVVEATSADRNAVPLDAPKVTDILDIVSLTNDAPDVFSVGQTIVTWTAQDQAGNSATATQTVSVIDTTAPVISAPADITAEATSADDNTIMLGEAKASDLVSVFSVTNDAPDVFPLGETLVTWTAKDVSGNNATATQKIMIIDTTAPKIIPPEDITAEATSAFETVVVLTEPESIDSVSDVTITNDAPNVFPLGKTTITWTATDKAGNSVSATSVVKIIDTTAPELIVPENIIVDATSLKTTVDAGSATASDHTDASPKITNDTPQLFPLGITTITWTAEDKYGNKATMTQTVTVEACGKPDSDYNAIIGTEDDDILFGTNLSDLIISLEGDDIIFAQKGNDCVLAGDGEDIIYANEGNDFVNGGDGADIIKGGAGQDVLIGSTGVDVIDGGDDDDSCITENDDDVLIKCE
jgi:hypothetical protein